LTQQKEKESPFEQIKDYTHSFIWKIWDVWFIMR